MRFLHLAFILVLATGMGCSRLWKGKSDGANSKASKEVTGLDGEDADFIIDNDDADGDLMLSEEGIAEKGSSELREQGIGDFADEGKAGVSINRGESMSASKEMSGEEGLYRVQKGETLMMIAFKLYGDYSQWRNIQNLNANINAQGLRTGMSLKYQVPTQKFEWNPAGEPYLVRAGDTLGTISNDKYGRTSKWRDIWNNNRPMIKDPNLIFAGFTLYYIPSRDVASE